jgi:hypothetical protein
MSRGPRNRHDHFAKDLLRDYLVGFAATEAERALRAEERSIDVFVDATSADESRRAALGVLGRMARGIAGFEAHRNPITADELRGAVAKALELRAELRRADTLWLRLLARGEHQRRAFHELAGLPIDHPLREAALTRVLHFVTEARQASTPTAEQQEILMNAERTFEQWKQEAFDQGRAAGEARGRAEDVLAVLEARGLRITKATRARVIGCEDAATLDRLIRRAAVVTSARELFDDAFATR